MTDDVTRTPPEPAAEGPEETRSAPTQPAPADASPAEPEVTQVVHAPTTPTTEPAAPAAPTPAAPAAQVAATSPVAPAAPAAARGGVVGRVRSITVGLVFFLTCLSLVLATTTWWLHDTVLGTDRFVALTSPLARDPAVQDALVQVTTTQIDEALNLGPIPSYVVTGIAREVYASDAFASVWERAMRGVHGRLVAVLRGEASFVQTSDGKVVINIFPLLDAVFTKINGMNIVIAGNEIKAPTLTNSDDPDASRAELSAALGRELKPTFGLVAVADSAKLETAQRYVALFDALVVVLFVLTALLALLTIVLARRRLGMLALLGLGGLVALLAARLVIASAADGLATAVVDAGPGAIIGGQVVTLIADSYREFARVILLISLAAAVVATAVSWLLVRRAGETGAGGRTGAVGGWFLALVGLSVALLALLLVGLTAATFAIVLVAYVVWLVVVIRSRRRAVGQAQPAAGPA
jgi:hypothetical protein